MERLQTQRMKKPCEVPPQKNQGRLFYTPGTPKIRRP